MRVRCGACRTQFEVSGAGRFACPVCGSINVVRNAAGTVPEQQGNQTVGGYQTAPGMATSGVSPAPTPPKEEPMPRIDCPDCGFNFIVGKKAKVTCPMCGVEVATGVEEETVE